MANLCLSIANEKKKLSYELFFSLYACLMPDNFVAVIIISLLIMVI